MAKKEGWNQSLHGVKTRSYKGGVDDAVGGATMGAGSPKDEPSYAAKYKSQASKAGGKARSGGGSTDHAKGYGQAEALNKTGSNRF